MYNSNLFTFTTPYWHFNTECTWSTILSFISQTPLSQNINKGFSIDLGDPWIIEGWQGSKKHKPKSFEQDCHLSTGLEAEKFLMIEQSFDSAETLDHKDWVIKNYTLPKIVYLKNSTIFVLGS